MKSKHRANKKSLAKRYSDVIGWLAVILLLVIGLVANYHYHEIAWALRASAGLVMLCLLLAIAAQTTGGKKAWMFLLEARDELRKVVWPTRQETVQVALMIVVVVLITVFVLWVIDGFLMKIIALLTR